MADGKLQAASGVKHDRDLDAIEFILRDSLSLTKEQMEDEKFDLVAFALGKTKNSGRKAAKGTKKENT
jgi:hypothetical protein